jgi:hypothetical protein
MEIRGGVTGGMRREEKEKDKKRRRGWKEVWYL